MSNFYIFISSLQNETGQGPLIVSDALGNKVTIQPGQKTLVPAEYKWVVPSGAQNPLVLKAKTEVDENDIQLFFTDSIRVDNQIEVHTSSAGEDKSITPITPIATKGTPLAGTLVIDPTSNLVIVGTMELEDDKMVGQS